MQNKPIEMIKYYRLLQDEMLQKKKVLDVLVDSKQRYTKGILCEDVVRRMMRSILPNDIAVAQGFVYHSGRKSQQCDVVLYNSARYAPFLSVNDLVVVPVEAVAAVIEVKTYLNQTELRKALECFKSIDNICSEALGYFPIEKHLVAFSSIALRTLLRCSNLTPFPSHLNTVAILDKGFLLQETAPSTNPQAYKSKDVLFFLAARLLSQFYFSTGIVGETKNPYAAYLDQISGEQVKLDD